MKYTILGFSQKKAIELGLDVTDLLIIRWFVDFYSSNKMVKINVGDKVFVWVNYSKIIEDIPIINMKKDMIYKRLKKICDIGIMEHETLKQGGTFSLYRLTDKYDELISIEQNKDSAENNYEGYGKNSIGGAEKNQDQNINLLKEDKSIKNNNNIYSAKDKKSSYGCYGRIKLTDAEYQKLIADYGKEVIDNQIALLDEYVESNNNKNKYTNFNLVLRKSLREKWFNKKEQNNGKDKRNIATFDYDQFID